jgi:hypothetical protein
MLNIFIFIYLVYLNTFVLSQSSNINFSVWEFIQANTRNSSRRLSGKNENILQVISSNVLEFLIIQNFSKSRQNIVY